MGALVQLESDFDLLNNQNKSAKSIMSEHGYTKCHDLVMGVVPFPVIKISSSPNPLSLGKHYKHLKNIDMLEVIPINLSINSSV